MKNLAVIVAGGQGRRFGTDRKKQFVMLEGRPVYLHSVGKFVRSGLFDEVRLIIPGDEEVRVREELDAGGLGEVKIRYGGQTRQSSVENGLSGGMFDFVAVHDSVRPLFSKELLAKGMEQVGRLGCVIPVIDIQDTVKETYEGTVVKTVNRESVKAVQTPQFFDYQKLKILHEEYHGGNYGDDSYLFELKHIPVFTIIGEKYNFKITNREDLILAESVLKGAAGCSAWE